MHARTKVLTHEVQFSAAAEEIKDMITKIEANGHSPDLAGRILIEY
jgi:hypothetical protein